MAERRMFAKRIIDSDNFIDMPIKAQCLYFHLSMQADDDGLICNPKKVIRMLGFTYKDFDVLVNNDFVILFESGITAIRHWKIHNYIRTDRYKESLFKKEKSLLSTDDNGCYYIGVSDGIPKDSQRAYQTETQVRLGKDRLGKDRLGEDIYMTAAAEETALPTPPKETKEVRHKYGEYKNVLLSDKELCKLKSEFTDDWEQRIERLSEYIASTGKSYKSHLATIRAWSKKESREIPTVIQKTKPKSDYDRFVSELMALRTED